MKTFRFKKAGSFGSAFFIFTFLFCFSIHAKPLKIVSLKPNITEILKSLEEGENIVGITKYCQKPNAKAKVIADYIHIDIESLLRLQPDVVFLSTENTQKKQFEALTQALKQSQTQIEVLNFTTLDDFYDSFIKIGSTLNKKELALNRVKALKDQLQTAKKNLPNLQNKTFAVVVQRQPLIVAAKNTYISTLISKLGLKNTFQKNEITYPVLNAEDLLQNKPDLIFDMSHKAQDNPEFLGQTVIPMTIEKYLAHPQSHEDIIHLLKKLEKQ